MLNVSLVLYRPDLLQLTAVLQSLLACPEVNRIFLIDNSPLPLATLPLPSDKIAYRFTGRNLGYGTGHNIALRQSLSSNVPYHLVLNSDIRFQAEDISTLLTFMDTHPRTGMLMPRVVYPNGELQYLCKQLPTPLDLIGRRFLPKRWMKKRMYRFEMRATGYDHIMNVPYLSGCFMLLRVSALREVGLFDERFFLYPEDLDLSRRMYQHYENTFYPDVTIVHDHQRGSYHSLRLLFVHIVNMCRYFNKWGWFSSSSAAMSDTRRTPTAAAHRPNA